MLSQGGFLKMSQLKYNRYIHFINIQRINIKWVASLVLHVDAQMFNTIIIHINILSLCSTPLLLYALPYSTPRHEVLELHINAVMRCIYFTHSVFFQFIIMSVTFTYSVAHSSNFFPEVATLGGTCGALGCQRSNQHFLTKVMRSCSLSHFCSSVTFFLYIIAL